MCPSRSLSTGPSASQSSPSNRSTAEALEDPASRLAVAPCARLPEETSCWPLLAQLRRRSHRQIFPIVYSHTAAEDVRCRLRCFDAGAKMVTRSGGALRLALSKVAAALQVGTGGGLR